MSRSRSRRLRPIIAVTGAVLLLGGVAALGWSSWGRVVPGQGAFGVPGPAAGFASAAAGDVFGDGALSITMPAGDSFDAPWSTTISDSAGTVYGYATLTMAASSPDNQVPVVAVWQSDIGVQFYSAGDAAQYLASGGNQCYVNMSRLDLATTQSLVAGARQTAAAIGFIDKNDPTCDHAGVNVLVIYARGATAEYDMCLWSAVDVVYASRGSAPGVPTHAAQLIAAARAMRITVKT